MHTLMDIVTFNRERASRHLHDPDRGWRIAGLTIAIVYLVSMIAAYTHMESSMLDALFVTAVFAFFALALIYVAGCERLRH
jgi:hypothetical protein